MVAGAVAVAVVVCALPALAGSPVKTRLVSKNSAGQPAEGADSRNASTSGSGRYVAFDSDADNLPGADGTRDVYVRDKRTGRTTLISKTTSGAPAIGGDSSAPSISASGRFVAYQSSATNLQGDDSVVDIFVRDRRAGTTRLVSKTTTGEIANGDSASAAISPSGRAVAFESSAPNLAGSDLVTDVYVRDRSTGKTRLMSKTSIGEPADGDSGDPSISGRYVAFESAAENLPGDDAVADVYIHDRRTAMIRHVSKTSGGTPATGGGSGDAAISESGRYVAFESTATNLPGLAARDVYVRDRKRGTTKLVSRTSSGDPATGGSSGDASISGLGRYVGFESDATNLPGDPAFDDVYVRDRRAGRTKLVSRTSGGDPGLGDDSGDPSISASGIFVAFTSAADNFPGDDCCEDIFLRGPLG